jgi:CheY-like chemotaxis protein
MSGFTLYEVVSTSCLPYLTIANLYTRMNSIMYVDDDEDDRLIFCEVVKAIRPDLICHVANDGIHALEILNDLVVHPDYIFLDMNMPRFSGTEFLIELRKSKHLRDIAVLMYSTSKTNRDAQLCKQLGVVDFLVKPSNLQGVYDQLRKVLDPRN